MGFPKCDRCCTVTASELNYMYDPQDIKTSMLENAINVTKLQYCQSLTDVSHDYMVVDAFTKPEGYNETIDINEYCLINSYNMCSHIVSCTCCYIALYDDCGTCICFFVCNSDNCFGTYTSDCQKYDCGYADGWICATGCLDFKNSFSLCNYTNFCFKVVGCAYSRTGNNTGGLPSCIIYSSSLFDEICLDVSASWSCTPRSVLCIICLDFYKHYDNCYSFYCNSEFVCKMIINNICNIPKICVFSCSKGCSYGVNNNKTCAFVQIKDFCVYSKKTTSNYNYVGLNGFFSNCYDNNNVCINTKISTNTICFSEPIKTSYLSLDKVGVGTVRYNVFGCCLFCCYTCCWCECCYCDCLQAFYKLDDSSGTICDYSGNNYHLSCVASLTYEQDGKYCKSVKSQGGAYAYIASSPSIVGNWTINVWVYKLGNAQGTNNTIVDIGNHGANNGFGLWANKAGCIGWRINQCYNNYTNCVQLVDNTWVMVTAVYDGSTIKLFKDGVCCYSTNYTTNPTSVTNYLKLFNREANNEAICARLDVVSVWDCAMSCTDVANLYESTEGVLKKTVQCSCIVQCHCTVPLGNNLEPNKTHALCTPQCCHSYEIIQCADGISCIKSYAILTGKA